MTNFTSHISTTGCASFFGILSTEFLRFVILVLVGSMSPMTPFNPLLSCLSASKSPVGKVGGKEEIC